LEQQIHLYESQSDSIRQGHDDAARTEMEAVIAYANFIYDRIKHIDEEWSGELSAGGAIPSEGDARAMEDLYARWCARAEANLKRAADLDARGLKVPGLDRFRQAYYEARNVLSVPADRVRQAARSARDGRTRGLGEIRDELRSQAD
jgi:hypothetical protein